MTITIKSDNRNKTRYLVRRLKKQWVCPCGRVTWKAITYRGFQVCIACYHNLTSLKKAA